MPLAIRDKRKGQWSRSMPKGPAARLLEIFNLETLLAYPYDFFGDILAENQHGRRAGFFPTPMNVVKAMVRMAISDDDARAKTVCDPCVGTGRMLLVASNYSYRLYGADIDGTVIKATLVNGYLYAPWLVKPFPFLDGPNLDLSQSCAVSDSLARNRPDYYEDRAGSKRPRVRANQEANPREGNRELAALNKNTPLSSGNHANVLPLGVPQSQRVHRH